MSFWQSFWLVVEVFFFLAYLVVLFHIVTDLFRDQRLGGFRKALWVLFLIVLPVVTALVYLVARGRGMTERSVAALARAEKGTEDYIRSVAGTSAVQQVATAKDLLDSGAITPEEFGRLKQLALTGA